MLRGWAKAGGLPPFDPASGDLPPATLEAHVAIDHAAYPPDPGQALLWSGQVQRLLARKAGAPVVVADDAAEPLAASRDDATNAKILFLLLGLPGVLVAGALGLAVASTLVEAERREEGLLRLRGADSGASSGSPPASPSPRRWSGCPSASRPPSPQSGWSPATSPGTACHSTGS